MLTEKTLNIFFGRDINQSSIPLNEGLHLPHGTKSAKVVTHTDLDGVTSGISMVQQLIKQGIPKERITVEFAQYGDEDKEKDEHTEKFRQSKPGQFVGVTDFAKLPKVKPFKIWNTLFNFKGDSRALLNLLQRDWKTYSQEKFDKEIIDTYKVPVGKFTNGNLKKLLEAFKAYNELKDYAEKNKKFTGFTPVTMQNIQELSFPVVNPQFLSDHHSNEQGALSGGKTGEIATGAKSEAEFFANKYTPGLWSQSDLKAISTVDSAGYTEAQLKNTVFLEKHFTGPDKQKNLATIVACIYDNLCKKDRNAAAWIIKNSQPSLVSLYTNTLKAAGYNGKRLQYVSALKNGEVEKAKQLLSEIPEELNKRYDRRGDPKQPIMSLDDWREKNKKDVENMKTGYKTEADEKKLEEIKGKRSAEAKAIRDEVKGKKGKVVAHNNFAIFNGKDPKTQYTRYATTLFSENGQRMPFSMRYWNGFFQIAKSTLYKGKVNFAEVNEHVLQDVATYLKSQGVNDMKIKIVMDEMKEKNGGHSGGIWSFQGFNKITPPSKVTDDKYWLAKKLEKKGSKSEIVNKVLNDKKPEIEKYEEIKNGAMKKAMNSAVYWTNKLYPVSPEDLKALQTSDEDFNHNSK